MRQSTKRKIASLMLPLLAGAAAAHYTPLSFWYDMKEGLIAFLGFLAASLMQVMPITANFVQTDKLNPSEAKKIVDSLTRQQHYWIGLLSATIAALLAVIIFSALKAPLETYTKTWHGLSYSSIGCFFIAYLFCFVLIKILGLFEGMLSLHNLRAELVIISANRAAAETKDSIQASAGEIRPMLPEGYGAIAKPPQ